MKNLLFSILLLTGFTAFAQPKGMGKNDTDAKKILDGVSAKFRSFKTITAKFNLKIENSAGKVQGTKSGVVNLKGTKYRINVTGQEIYSDGNTSWTYDKSSNEVQINKVERSSTTITPQKMFTNFYDKDFLYKTNPDVKVAGKMMQEIELTPIDKSKPFFKVLVHIDKATQTIRETKVFEKNGNRYTYSIVSMQTNTGLPDALFVFDAKKFPKVEVIDLR
ncbi:MAG TPA: outer membrane lipoprotein carrier protein LolA [Chitinophagaceae bacterium]|nr:outer membrane lipoprotein carrier protein LolA [Chitinophagaceae bacterium]